MAYDLLIIVSQPASAAIAAPLARACNEAGVDWAIFFTNDGVTALEDAVLNETLSGARSAIVCQEAWRRFMGDAPIPIESGSQTNLSAMAGEASRTLSL